MVYIYDPSCEGRPFFRYPPATDPAISAPAGRCCGLRLCGASQGTENLLLLCFMCPPVVENRPIYQFLVKMTKLPQFMGKLPHLNATKYSFCRARSSIWPLLWLLDRFRQKIQALPADRFRLWRCKSLHRHNCVPGVRLQALPAVLSNLWS